MCNIYCNGRVVNTFVIYKKNNKFMSRISRFWYTDNYSSHNLFQISVYDKKIHLTIILRESLTSIEKAKRTKKANNV